MKKFNKFHIVNKRKIFFAIPLVLFVVAALFFAFKGFNWDIDFLGGTTVHVSVGKEMTNAEMAKISGIIEQVTGEKPRPGQRAGNPSEGQVIFKFKEISEETKHELLKKISTEYGLTYEVTGEVTKKVTDQEKIDKWYKVEYTEKTDDKEGFSTITVEYGKTVSSDLISSVKSAVKSVVGVDAKSVEAGGEDNKSIIIVVEKDLAADVKVALAENLGKLLELEYQTEETTVETYVDKEALGKWLLSYENVSATVGKELTGTAIKATIIAIILMLVYISIRFEILSGIAAVLTLCHDLVIVLFAYSLFGIPMDITSIAVVLTILGYCINAVIIIFDRVRENLKNVGPRKNFGDVVNESIWQTMNRSLNTTITTLLPLIMLCILGVTSIRNFAFPILIGIVAGLYSSVFVSGSIWVMLHGKKK